MKTNSFKIVLLHFWRDHDSGTTKYMYVSSICLQTFMNNLLNWFDHLAKQKRAHFNFHFSSKYQTKDPLKCHIMADIYNLWTVPFVLKGCKLVTGWKQFADTFWGTRYRYKVGVEILVSQWQQQSSLQASLTLCEKGSLYSFYIKI